MKGQRFWQSWYDIVGRYEAGEYGGDNGGESLEALKDKLGGDKKTEEGKQPDYTKKRFECNKLIYNYDIDDCKKKEEKLLVSIINDEETGTKHLLRCENYGFWHNRDFFIPFRIDEGDGFDGEGFAEKLWDTNLYANAMHNQRVDRGTLMNIPFFKGEKQSDVQETRLELAKGIVFWMENPDSFQQVAIQGAPISDLVLEEQMLEKWSEMLVSITSGASGRESPTDPRAPASKTIALLQEQDVGIADFIDCLDPSFAELAYQIFGLYYQFGFNDEEGGEPVIRELVGDKYKFDSISRQDLKVRGMEFGLRCSTSGMNEILEELKFNENFMVLMSQPEIQQDSKRRWSLIREKLDKAGLQLGSGIILSEEEAEKEKLEMMKKALRQLVEEKMKGISEEAKNTVMQGLAALGLMPPQEAGGTPSAPTLPEGGPGAQEIAGAGLPSGTEEV